MTTIRLCKCGKEHIAFSSRSEEVLRCAVCKQLQKEMEVIWREKKK